ncbi:MAG: glycosyltransferase [Deltaproteobacteria bacterium]|nr:glycosyltransferase [Deltaproteobacteria bacterium]MBW2069462.1 glycosyltransferase [Deltaproteobacteria bacterium]
MKVLHVGKFFPPAIGGIENFLSDLVKWQVRSGIEICVLAHDHKVLRRTQISRTAEGFSLIRLATLGSFAYVPVAPSFPVMAYKIMKTWKPDLVHLHLPNASAFCFLAFAHRASLVIHWHSDVVPSKHDRKLAMLYRFYKPWETALLRKAKVVIATSPPYLESSATLKPFRDKCVIVPLGVDPARLEQFSPFPAIHSRNGRLMVFTVGRFSYYKGFQYLIKSVTYSNNFFVVIAGDGPLRRNLMKLRDRLNLRGRVFFTGKLGIGQLNTLLNGCDIFCLPSIERTEAFGLVLLEAMYFAKPLLTTSIPGSGVSWVNENGVTGLCVPPGSAEAIGAAVNELDVHEEVRNFFGRNGSKRFNRCFHIARVSEEIGSVYEAI